MLSAAARLAFRPSLLPTKPTPPRLLTTRWELKLIKRCRRRRGFILTIASSLDDDGFGDASLGVEESSMFMWSSGPAEAMEAVSLGEEEESDGDVNPASDADLLPVKVRKDRPKTTSTARKGFKKRRIPAGFLITICLISLSGTFLLWLDWCSWKVVRIPLKPFLSTYPFLVSAVLSACLGCVYVPVINKMRIHQIFRSEGPRSHFSKSGTPTMGGLFFIPIGVIVAIVNGGNNVRLFGAVLATLAFAAIGLLDDLLSCIKSHNYGLPGWAKLSLQVAIGMWFSFWLDAQSITTPYNMKFLVPLPPPFGLLYLGKLYHILTAFCFAAMSNGVNLTDGLDGLAGGTAALAFLGMSVAVLPLCPELAVFGVAMSGACIGFLFHNRYKASIFMGDTGSLALGGALAAMAACTGMFFPLFISSGVFFVEVLSVIMQVVFKKTTETFYGARSRIFRMAPIHHHFELCGVREPVIVASAYVVAFILALCAGYVGLISA